MKRDFKFETDYLARLLLASKKSEVDILEEFEEIFPKAMKDYKKLTELVVSLGILGIKRSKKDHIDDAITQSFYELHQKARVWGIENLTGDEFAWLYKYTRTLKRNS